ncbi:MAG: 4-hydroxybenzoate polyprenyltransferase [Polaribacter sp.]|jgi:4-hydroxybenzoate polyprenyltransferase
MLWQTQFILSDKIEFTYLTGLVFLATLFLYAAHRIVGISRLKDFFDVDRYNVIASFKWHIFLYAAVAGVGCLYCFLYLDRALQWALILPGLFSLAYVIPFLGNKKRLRDVNHVKIYLIAIVWAFVTVVLPALELKQATTLPVLLMFIERVFFIFIITLPFDIRDLKVDAFSEVKTLPAQLGLEKTLKLGYSCAAVFLLLVLVNLGIGTYSIGQVVGLFISGISTTWLLSKSSPDRHDYFYSGLMDGTMVFQFLLVYFCCYFW